MSFCIKLVRNHFSFYCGWKKDNYLDQEVREMLAFGQRHTLLDVCKENYWQTVMFRYWNVCKCFFFCVLTPHIYWSFELTLTLGLPTACSVVHYMYILFKNRFRKPSWIWANAVKHFGEGPESRVNNAVLLSLHFLCQGVEVTYLLSFSKTRVIWYHCLPAVVYLFVVVILLLLFICFWYFFLCEANFRAVDCMTAAQQY